MEEIFLKCTLENDTYNCVVLNEGSQVSLKTINNTQELEELFNFNVPNGDYIAHLLFKSNDELVNVYNEEFENLNGNFTVKDGVIYDIEDNMYVLNEDTNIFEGENYNLIYYGLNFFELIDNSNNKKYGVQFMSDINIKSLIKSNIKQKLYEINNDSQFWWTGKGVNLLNNFFTSSGNSMIPEEEDEVTLDELKFLFEFNGMDQLLKSYFNSEEINVQMLIVWLLNNMYITLFDPRISRKGLKDLKKLGEEFGIEFDYISDIVNNGVVTESNLYSVTASLINNDENKINDNKILKEYMYSEYSLLLMTLYDGLNRGIITNENEPNTTIEHSNSKLKLKQGSSNIIFNVTNDEVVNTDNKYIMNSNNYYYLNYYGNEVHFYVQI